MIFFVRNNDNETIVDIEVYKTGDTVRVKSNVMIDTYSNFLLNNVGNKTEIIFDFDMMDNFNEHLLRIFGQNGELRDSRYDLIISNIRRYLKHISELYNLTYVED